MENNYHFQCPDFLGGYRGLQKLTVFFQITLKSKKCFK